MPPYKINGVGNCPRCAQRAALIECKSCSALRCLDCRERHTHADALQLLRDVSRGTMTLQQANAELDRHEES